MGSGSKADGPGLSRLTVGVLGSGHEAHDRLAAEVGRLLADLEVNLLTGDHTVSATDVDEMGLTVTRSATSRTPVDGYVPMPERLTANQRQVATDLAGFTVPGTSAAARSTARGQGEVTPADSLEITPVTASSNDTYVAVGGDNGALRLGMQPGRTYRATGWVYVPAGSGLTPGSLVYRSPDTAGAIADANATSGVTDPIGYVVSATVIQPFDIVP